jgi:hypothetical protein
MGKVSHDRLVADGKGTEDPAMLHAQLTETVRRLAKETFAQLRLAEHGGPRELILIRKGIYCGRRFELPGGHAVWSFDEDRLSFFQPDGSVLLVIENASTLEPAMRKAA